MAKLPLTIGGTDFSDAAYKYGYSVSYTPEMGRNGGIMLDGSETVDLLKWKAVLTVSCNAMLAADLSALLTACMVDYVTVRYFDTKTNAERTAQFIPTFTAAQLLIYNNGKKWFSGPTLTFKER